MNKQVADLVALGGSFQTSPVLMIGITIAPELPFMILNCGFGMYHMSSGRSRPKQWSIPTAESKAKRSLFAVGYTAKVV